MTNKVQDPKETPQISNLIKFVQKTDALEKKLGLMKIFENTLPVFLLVSSLVLATTTWLSYKAKDTETADLTNLPITGGETANPALYFSNSYLTVPNNSSRVLNIMINTDDAEVDGVDLVLKYDPEFLNIVEINNGDFFPSYPLKDYNFADNRIMVTGLSDFGSPESGYGTFCSIVISTKQVGSTILEILAEPNTAIDSNIVDSRTSEDILTIGDQITLTIE